MKKIAVFGKPANGKSTLSHRLSLATGIKKYSIDSILYESSGKEIERSSYETMHSEIISSPEWIIEGFGPLNSLDSFYQRIAAADTLVYIDLSYPVTYWLVVKRLLKSIYKKPEGWPKNSSVLDGTVKSFKTLRLCPLFWNDKFLHSIESRKDEKNVFVIRSLRELKRFANTVYNENESL
ncbi:adenylate kinase [Alteromonas gracilis]|uniref:adenylate kinase n=1 Tax=Alteromonas gracilis TaxID=1479524 RepID=UPI0030CC413F